MKRLTTAIVGLSLFAGSAAFAVDGFEGFYPIENVDTPDYLVDKGEQIQSMAVLSGSSISSGTLTAFFPAEDVDTHSVVYQSIESGHTMVGQSLAKSSLEHCTLSSFYPEENVDTRVAITC